MSKYKKLKVDYKTPLAGQLKKLGIESYIDLSQTTDQYPYTDYITDAEDGKEMLGKSVNEATEELKKVNRRPLNIYEGLALFRKNKKVLQNHYIDLGGSRYGSDSAPYLYLFDDRPRLGYDSLAGSYDKWGSASTAAASGTSALDSGILGRLLEVERKVDNLWKWRANH